MHLFIYKYNPFKMYTMIKFVWDFTHLKYKIKHNTGVFSTKLQLNQIY
jgi:hypothetical protein